MVIVLGLAVGIWALTGVVLGVIRGSDDWTRWCDEAENARRERM